MSISKIAAAPAAVRTAPTRPSAPSSPTRPELPAKPVDSFQVATTTMTPSEWAARRGILGQAATPENARLLGVG